MKASETILAYDKGPFRASPQFRPRRPRCRGHRLNVWRQLVDFNPFAYDFHQDPNPTYAWLRDEAPAYQNLTMGFWALSRFDDVLGALHDYQTFTSTQGVT